MRLIVHAIDDVDDWLEVEAVLLEMQAHPFYSGIKWHWEYRKDGRADFSRIRVHSDTHHVHVEAAGRLSKWLVCDVSPDG